MMESAIFWQWGIVLLSSLGLYFLAPMARNAATFFRAREKGKAPGLGMLTSSLVISWLFAKSITNAANLGEEFGFVGGVAYAGYYLSFAVAGVVLYQLRTRGGFSSIHQFLGDKFGRGAVAVFTVLIAIRLFNEVWSNTLVIGSYFGPQGSGAFYLSILVFTALTLAYSLKGGMRSSLLTDLIQMLLFGVLLFVILAMLLPGGAAGPLDYISSGEWGLASGVNLLLVALIQSLSYPFHDPVLTDRAFISPPRLTRRSFFLATGIGALCILLFSWVGIYARLQGLGNPAAVTVSQSLGVGMMLLMNFIMVTSAASTLDSTFSSFAKLVVIDLKQGRQQPLRWGRWTMVVLTLLGTLPIFMGPEVLSATTVSGTMVIGLAPVFLLWWLRVPPISFYLAVGVGLFLGILVALGAVPEAWHLSEGKYADLLSVNLIGTGLCFVVFLLPRWLRI